MKRKRCFTYTAAMIVLMVSASMSQVLTKQPKKIQSASSTTGVAATPSASAVSTSVTGSGAQGQLVKWTGSEGTSVVGNSIITETKLGSIGIGTTAPGSKLSVQGMIETTLGGYKFPDGTIQTTASVFSVPLVLRGPSRPAAGVIEVKTTTEFGTGIFSVGGAGGNGIEAFGGKGVDSNGGQAIITLGGEGNNGGVGAFVQGGSTNRSGAATGNGGDAGIMIGGFGNGVGSKGGRGLVAAGGEGGNGAKQGLAGQFFGDVSVEGAVAITGNLSKGGGSFKIDHPLDPENKYLYHSFVESPDMKNIYDGTVTTDANGDAIVTLPDWFEALNQDFRYQLTVIDTFAQAIVAQRIKGNRFIVKTNAPNVEVCWQVTGTRHDAYANKHRIPVEELKPEAEHGLYLHPDAFNKSEDKGIQFARKPQRSKEKTGGEQ